MKRDAVVLEWSAGSHNAGMTLRKFLREEKQMSRKLLAEVKFEGGHLLINEKTVQADTFLEAGDVIKIVFPPEEVSPNILPYNFQLSVLYEDDHVLVVSKPPGLPVLPMSDRLKPSLSGALLYKYQKAGWPATIHIVTRLDRDTSGVILIAKHRYAHGRLFLAQQTGEIKRSYEALIEGAFPWEAVSIHAPIGRREGSIVAQEVIPSGKPAVTHVNKVTSGKSSRLRLQLETGRTHQIRVHLSWLGWPLVGDTLYGGTENKILRRQALHAVSIMFPHPVFEKKIRLEAPTPF